MMEFESDRMTGLELTDDVVRPELKVVLEERNSRVENNFGARLAEQMEVALFLNHPYGRPIIGWRHEIEQLTRDDAIEFYRRFYTPNNAILIVAGDVASRGGEGSSRRRPMARSRGLPKSNPASRPQEPAQELPARSDPHRPAPVTQPRA